ncbi:N-acetylglucosamine-6-phosphate deacetylase [Corynebacterium mendelii]|uniref:N-acetylglucosamine-6-phosphate deacetylase n=1 Tax=Corynebacterium mendelii TaxID=2765362 RepID=A0A939E1E2_9CORY|nr:N-acetylglucosamine-6-phosphate deacetylase [Corynebacterium mendelii]MBN9644923.1 N-acetylglucosamine-6-phosphate deacetylase [Corynebacterium mendelii]
MSSLVIHSATIYDGTIGGVTRNGCVRAEGGRITHLGQFDDYTLWPDADEIIDAHGAPVCPGYIDIHHHGGGGLAFDDGAKAVEHVIAKHRAHGTTRCVASFVTDDLPLMEQRISEVAELVKANPHLLGIHPEGPFLDAGHKGAHPEDKLIDPAPEAIKRIIDAGKGTLVQMTLAPEKNHAMEAIKLLSGHGVKASVGHTSCDYETAQQAFDNGATILTHCFNGMNGIHHRAPGPVIAALRDERVWLEIINDTIHVHPDVIASLFAEAPERVVLITDAMSATCNPDGEYMLGSLEVVVKDGVATLKGGTSLAGSTLTMDRAVANTITKVGVAPDVAVAAATSHPATAISMDDKFGRIGVGYPDDLLVLDPVTFMPTMIYTDGEKTEPATI